MTIKTNQWYIFKNQDDKRHFLRLVSKDMNERGQDLIDMSVYLDKECLLVLIDDLNKLKLRYRMKYNSEYIDAIFYNTEDKTSEDLTMTSSNICDNKIIKLIDETAAKEYDKVMRQYYHDYEELLIEFFEQQSNVELLKCIIENLDSMYLPYVYACITDNLLNVAEQDKIKLLEKTRNDADKLLTKRYTELKSLLSIADTFEQKYQLLQDYGIVAKYE